MEKMPSLFIARSYDSFICFEQAALSLIIWRRNYFFLNFSTPVYKMSIIQEPNTLEL